MLKTTNKSQHGTKYLNNLLWVLYILFIFAQILCFLSEQQETVLTQNSK